jgi:hypothetical protein
LWNALRRRRRSKEQANRRIQVISAFPTCKIWKDEHKQGSRSKAWDGKLFLCAVAVNSFLYITPPFLLVSRKIAKAGDDG